jgi:hypothetical protein
LAEVSECDELFTLNRERFTLTLEFTSETPDKVELLAEISECDELFTLNLEPIICSAMLKS